jgi:hypothetical protein
VTAQQQRLQVPGVEEGHPAGGQVQLGEQGGDEPFVGELRADRLVHEAKRGRQVVPAAAAVPVGPDRQGGDDARRHPVPHRVEDRHMIAVEVQRVVEGVTADVVRELHLPGDDGLGGVGGVIGGSNCHCI